MTKRILSVVLVLVVFFGGYAVLPKKYNPLPTESVYAASYASGGYKLLAPVTLYKEVVIARLSSGYTISELVPKRFSYGTIIGVNSSGYTPDGYFAGGILSNSAYVKKVY